MPNAFRLVNILPILLLSGTVFAQGQVCDVDLDGDVDRNDIQLIFAARNQPATGPDDPRDADGDGIITVLDARTCIRQCTLPRCAEPPPPDPADAPKFDVNDDGNIDNLDVLVIEDRLGLQAGQAGYREGLDLVPDGIIDNADISGILARLGSTGVATVPTTFLGTVFDGLGNRLQGVSVLVGDSPTGCTDRNGVYGIPVGPADYGENLVTFVGPTFDPDIGTAINSCDPSATDPTPDFLSGQYPTIPNKPVYINGGIDNVFRAISLPERDLTESQDLSTGALATNVGGNAWLLNVPVAVQNGGAMFGVPAGCTATFPAGEDPVLSITRIDPSRLPVPMPPGLFSTVIASFQPGGTEIDCPAGTEIFADFDNVDGLPVGMGDLIDGPFLSGIVDGVFTPLVACEVLAGGVTMRCGPIPLPFEFGWHLAGMSFFK